MPNTTGTMTIIDAFCGIGPWSQRDRRLPYRPEEILGLMDHFGIDRALAVANAAGSPMAWTPDTNRYVAEVTAREPRFMPAFALSLHPHRESQTFEQTVETMRAANVRAVWLWTRMGQLFGSLQSWLIGDWLKFCAAKRLPVFCHIEGLHFNDLHALCTEFPKLRLIVAGLGYSCDPTLYPLLRLHPNLHVCLGHYFIPAADPDRFLAHFPPERLIFGSGLPFFTPGGLIAHVMYADADDAVKAQILGGTLLRLMDEVRL